MSEIDPKLIARINELAAKAKRNQLTAEETAERQELRHAYLEQFRAGFRTQVENLRLFDQQGQEVTPEKVRQIQRDKNLRDD
ncbi:DUF896 domain-containing protein [Lapidilactobacillus salsurivasis]